jgi:5-methylcytosine-specific restriction endonuclease McrA
MSKDRETKNLDDKRRYKERISLFKKMLGEKCIFCGTDQDLEFDHIKPETKLFKITDTNRSLKGLLQELEKCQLLCNSCHKEKTGKAQHGSLTMYSHHSCRCESCRNAWNMYHRKYPPVV